jgi:hypothetical protein
MDSFQFNMDSFDFDDQLRKSASLHRGRRCYANTASNGLGCLI